MESFHLFQLIDACMYIYVYGPYLRGFCHQVISGSKFSILTYDYSVSGQLSDKASCKFTNFNSEATILKHP